MFPLFNLLDTSQSWRPVEPEPSSLTIWALYWVRRPGYPGVAAEFTLFDSLSHT